MSPAALAGSTLAVGDAAKVSLGSAANTVITAFGLFSLAAIVNLQVMVATRITYRMARHGSLPPLLGEVARGGTPRNSLIVLTLASFGFAATGGYESIVRLYTPWTVGVVLMVCLSAIGLRLHEPDLPRPWKMPLFPWIAILASLIQAGLIVVAVWDDPRSGALSAIAAVAPIPLYWLLAPRWRTQATARFG
jgi:APA family basic amino acid/polyamine antiporter